MKTHYSIQYYVYICRLLFIYIYICFSSEILFEVIKLYQTEHEYKNTLVNIYEN
jgi:hypothetical protein